MWDEYGICKKKNNNNNKFHVFASFLQGLLDVSDKYIYDQLISGKDDDSFYKG